MKDTKRRHWYDNEKLDIIAALDSGNIIPDKNQTVLDPKSGQNLSVLTINQWRAGFIARGLMPTKSTESIKQPSRMQERSSVSSLLLNILLKERELEAENRKLRRLLQSDGGNSEVTH